MLKFLHLSYYRIKDSAMIEERRIRSGGFKRTVHIIKIKIVGYPKLKNQHLIHVFWEHNDHC